MVPFPGLAHRPVPRVPPTYPSMWILLGLTFLAGAALLLVYNRFVRLRLQTENAWADVDVQLKRRYDLIPNLVEVVRGYAGHERETLQRVVEAREGATRVRDAGPSARAEAETQLTQALFALNARMEAYPDLKATASFQNLSHALTEVEDHIQNARRYYNATVREFNTAVEQVPGALVAGPMGFRSREFFAAHADTQHAPAVAL
jgi:LemA protein